MAIFPSGARPELSDTSIQTAIDIRYYAKVLLQSYEQLRTKPELQVVLLKLEVTNVCKDYPTPSGSLTVLSDISFTLQSGDATAFTGPSGTGKSTLLYILGGLETPSKGSVTLGDKNVFGMSPAELAKFRLVNLPVAIRRRSGLMIKRRIESSAGGNGSRRD